MSSTSSLFKPLGCLLEALVASFTVEAKIQKEQQSRLKLGILENQKCMKLMPKHPSKHPKTSQHIPESLILVTLIFGVTRDHYGGGQAVVGSVT